MTLPLPTSSNTTMAASTMSMRPSRSFACFQRSAQTGSCAASFVATSSALIMRPPIAYSRSTTRIPH
jgi:hypothetical protein